MIGESFGFYVGDIFCYQWDDDFRCVCINDEIFYSYGFYFLFFLYVVSLLGIEFYDLFNIF